MWEFETPVTGSIFMPLYCKGSFQTVYYSNIAIFADVKIFQKEFTD